MATVGEATIKLNFDGKSLKASAEKEVPAIEKTLGKLGDAAKTTGKAITAGILAGFQVTKGVIQGITGEAIKQYGEFEQLFGGVQTLYGAKGAENVEEYAKQTGKSVDAVRGEFNKLMDAQNIVMANAEEAFRTSGLSLNDYMQTATGFAASLIQSLGGDTQKAASIADMAIQDMADNANKMGTDLASIQTAYAGFSKGQYMLLDNLKLGYGGTKTEMERLLADAEKFSGVKYDIKNLSDVYQAIHVIQERMDITGTTAKEAGTTIQGSFGMVKASLKNLVGGLADGSADIEKLIDDVVTSIFGDGSATNLGLLGNAMPAIERAIAGIAKALPKLIKSITSRLGPLLKEIIPPLMTATTQVFIAIAEALPEIAPILADSLAQMLIAIIPYLPTILGAFFSAIIRFVTVFLDRIGQSLGPWLGETLGKMGNAIGNWFMGLGNAIGSFFGDFAAKAMEAIDQFAQGFWQAIENIKNWFASIPAFFGNIFKKITGLFKSVGTKIGEVVGGAFKAVINGVLGFIEGVINTPVRAINALIDTINAVPGIDLGRLDEFHLPRLAKGGVATGSTIANIGEAGKEAVIPLERNTAEWAGPLAKAIADQFAEQGLGGAAGVTVYMTNNINSNLDADEIGQRLMTSIRRAA